MWRLSDRIARIRYGFEDSKPEIEVTVFGSYEPSAYKTRLTNLVADLRRSGWTDSDIVQRRFSNSTPMDASYRAVDQSDVLLFVIVPGGSPQGMNVELAYILQKRKAGDESALSKTWLLIADLREGEHSPLGRIVTGEPVFAEFNTRSFGRDDRVELFWQAESCLVEYLQRGITSRR